MSNPYVHKASGEPIVGSSKLPAMGRTRTGALVASADPLVANNGEINASNNRDAMQLIATLLEEASKGSVVQASKTQLSASERQAISASIVAAYHDNTSSDFAIYGEEIANTVRDTSARAGFLRRFLGERELVAQETAKIRLRKHAVNAFAVGPNSAIVPSRHDGKFFFPEEVTYAGSVQIAEADLYKEGMGLLDEKADEALEMIMVAEDRDLKALLDQCVAATGASLNFSTFTPSVFSSLKQYVQNTGGLPVESCWMANDLWTDINSGNTDFSDYFSPIVKHDLNLTGRIGRLQDVEIHTDAFLESRLRVLNAGELYFTAQPQFLGEVLSRAAIMSTETSGANINQAWRGWFIREILAIGIGNINGVSRGKKI